MVKKIVVDGYNDKLYSVSIGENSIDNWKIIDSSHQNDLWFHLDKFPSSHVILHCGNDKISDIGKNVLIECANYCKSHSKYKNMDNIGIIYTHIKYVRKGEKTGSVYTKKSQLITL